MVPLVEKLVQMVKMVIPLVPMVQMLPTNGTIGRTPNGECTVTFQGPSYVLTTKTIIFETRTEQDAI